MSTPSNAAIAAAEKVWNDNFGVTDPLPSVVVQCLAAATAVIESEASTPTEIANTVTELASNVGTVSTAEIREALEEDRAAEVRSEREHLRSLNGTEWPAAVERIWDENCSRFASLWSNLPHHDQVSIFRILTH